MKSSILFVTLLSLCAFTYSPNQKGLAQVRKVDGLDIYIYSEPLADFEEVFQITGFWNWEKSWTTVQPWKMLLTPWCVTPRRKIEKLMMVVIQKPKRS